MININKNVSFEKTSHDIILNWLQSEEVVLKFKNKDNEYVFFKYPYTEEINLIFEGDYKYIGIDSELKYCGIYDQLKKKLYDVGYPLLKAMDLSFTNNPYKSLEEIKQEKTKKINCCITNYINDHKKIFYELAKDYTPSINESDLYYSFINNISKIEYQSDVDYLSKDDILRYLADDIYVLDYSEDYITKRGKFIGERLKDIDAKNTYLDSINADVDHPIHKAKQMNNILKNTNCVMVHVFINKNNYNFDFRYDKEMLVNGLSHSYMSSYSMSPSDRAKFKEYFGRNDDFNYKDIYKIEYRNKPIYLDENFEKKIKEEECSL